MATVSQKIHNYNYAPGIATYGVVGKTGPSGTNGSNLFFTNISLIDNVEFKILVSQIINEFLPIKNSSVKVDRPYQNGDSFFTMDGLIYTLFDIEHLISNADVATIGKYTKYFQLVGRITVDTVSYLNLLKGAQRLELNTNYKGFDLVTASTNNVSTYINDNAVMNIVSDNLDEFNNINLIQLSAVNSYNVMDGQLLIYFDTNDNAFHITTNEDCPLIINSDVKVNQDSVERELDQYSTVLTSSDPITVFKSMCESINYSLINHNDGNDASYVQLSIIVNESADKYELLKTKLGKIFNNLFVKVYANGTIYTHKISKQSENTVVNNSLVYTIQLPQYITEYSQVDAVSLLYNTEIFIKKL